MNTKNFADAVKQCSLPFVYYGERLNEEKCQKALKKIGADANVLAVFLGLAGVEGIVIFDNGIKFFRGGFSKGEFQDQFIIHHVYVYVKKQSSSLDELHIKMLIWDISRKKSFYHKFSLSADNVDVHFERETAEELHKLLATLTEKTGTEYDAVSEEKKVKEPNVIDFVWQNIHAIIAINDSDIIIRKMKIDKKTKIQTPKGEPLTISRSVIDSIKIKRAFSLFAIRDGMELGVGCGGILLGLGLMTSVFVIFIGLIVLFLKAILVCFILAIIGGLISSFPKTLFIYQKDGTIFKTVIRGGEEEYERVFNVLFK